MATRRRILKELDDMSKDSISGMAAEVVHPSGDMTHLRGHFKGPPGTSYEGGDYYVDIRLPDNYPFVPPKMKFETKVWHPNVSSQTGAICLDTLSAKWSPVLTIKTALLSLQSLLAAPEPGDPQDAEVARMMINEPEAFRAKAKEWAIRYANAPGKSLEKLSPEEEERRKKLALYDGFDEPVIERFTAMGFSVQQVVAALRRAGVKRGAGIGEDAAGRVVEGLISG